jgi:hypothetical protein
MDDDRTRIVPSDTWANAACQAVSLANMRRAQRMLEALLSEQKSRDILMHAKLTEAYGEDVFLPVDQWPLGRVAIDMTSENGRRLAMAIRYWIEFTPDWTLRALMPPAPIPSPPERPQPGV